MKLTELKNQLVIVNYKNKHNAVNEQSGQIIDVDTNKIVFQIDENGTIPIARPKLNYIMDEQLNVIWRKEVLQNEV